MIPHEQTPTIAQAEKEQRPDINYYEVLRDFMNIRLIEADKQLLDRNTRAAFTFSKPSGERLILRHYDGRILGALRKVTEQGRPFTVSFAVDADTEPNTQEAFSEWSPYHQDVVPEQYRDQLSDDLLDEVIPFMDSPAAVKVGSADTIDI